MAFGTEGWGCLEVQNLPGPGTGLFFLFILPAPSDFSGPGYRSLGTPGRYLWPLIPGAPQVRGLRVTRGGTPTHP